MDAAAATNETGAELSSRETDPLPVGAIVDGRYALRRVLGRGAAAVVFAAEHLRVRRQVALKLPLVDPAVREILSARLRRETDALARVRHPAVVDVLDAGESDGLPFLAMELLEGRTMSGLIAARGRLQCDEAVKVGMNLAEGLGAVHAAGLVHRDVKPSNVLVTRSPIDQVHLCDFGIAKLSDPSDAPASKLTQHGAILGTLEYMPMEALVAAGQADQRTDVYALGVTLFECLSGAVPLDGPLGRILQRMASSQLPSVSEARADVPAQLAEVVARCLARDPEARYGTMAEVAAALGRCAQRPLDAIDLLRAGEANTAATVVPAPAVSHTARREHARAPYVALASLQRENGPSLSGRIEDLSEGGVLLMSHETCPPGEVLRLRFGLPISGRVLALLSRVRWTRKARTGTAIGLEFQDLPEAARDEIRQYVALMGTSKTP